MPVAVDRAEVVDAEDTRAREEDNEREDKLEGLPILSCGLPDPIENVEFILLDPEDDLPPFAAAATKDRPV